MTSKKKKGNLKYTVTNNDTSEVILLETTKKATTEWLHEQLDTFDETAHLEFAKSHYGDKITIHEFDPSVIEHVNHIAVNERIKKIIKAPVVINGVTYSIKGE